MKVRDRLRRSTALAAAFATGLAATAWATELASPAGDGSVGANLFAAADGRIFLSWIDRLGPGRDALRFSVLEGGRWSRPQQVAEGDNWFVNWADFPSVVALPDGSLAAHWLVRSAAAPYAYDVRIARSTDGGSHWSEPVVPHRDGTATEHGFVSLLPARDGRLGAAWLDGRNTGGGDGEHGHAGGAMTLRYAAIGADGRLTGEALLDARVCDCCQTGAAMTAEGPLIVYRDRSEREERDIAMVRLRDGRWSEPRPLPRDGWRIDGCPVNGPAIAAQGRRVAVAWFTAAREQPRVRIAFSADAGASFGEPVTVDDGRPQGRVDLVLLADGSAVVSWIESSATGSSLRLRRVRPDGTRGPASTVVPEDGRLANGFPRLALEDGQRLVVAWTAQDRVRTARVPVP
jgi:hypothetical protein